MKINQSSDQHVTTTGVSQTGSFHIQASAHAFRMLSSGLYTKKIQAVIRELSCNAADAHKLNGNKDKPFDIKLPNALDSQFYVRDYGPGLSHEDVMQLYTTYFQSTKQMSNDFTGGFGVGSKSPFAYTDMFTVVSIHNGEKRIYSAYLNDEGLPMISQMGEAQKTNEPSGINVGFPVKPENYREFEQEALNVFEWFDSPFNVLGSTRKIENFRRLGIHLENEDVVVFGSKDKPIAQRDYDGRHGVVLMGNVHYPFSDDEQLQKNESLRHMLDWMDQWRPVYKVNIGDMSVAASREALQYDTETRKFAATLVEKGFLSLSKSVWKKIKKEMGKNTDSFEAYQKANKLLSNWKLDAEPLRSQFLKLVGATPEELKIFQTRYLIDPTNVPTTFSVEEVVANGYGNKGPRYSIGTVLNAKLGSHKKTVLDVNHDYLILENGARAHGLVAEAEITRVIEKYNSVGRNSYNTRIYQIVPVANVHLKNALYASELEAWKKYTGLDVQPFTKIGQTLKEPDSIEVMSTGGSYYGIGQNFDIFTTSNKPFFYMTESEFTGLNKGKIDWIQRKVVTPAGSYLHARATTHTLRTVLKNLKAPDQMQTMDLVVIKDADKEKIKRLGFSGTHLIDDVAKKLLMDPKYQKRIKAIKPMMDNLTSTFSALRIRLRKHPDYQKALENTKLGEWMKHMDAVKGGGSMDAATTFFLNNLQEYMGEKDFPSAIPEYYNGEDVAKCLKTGYPFLDLIVDKNVSLSPTQFEHLKTYMTWMEGNGSHPPENKRIVEESVVTPATSPLVTSVTPAATPVSVPSAAIVSLDIDGP